VQPEPPYSSLLYVDGRNPANNHLRYLKPFSQNKESKATVSTSYDPLRIEIFTPNFLLEYK